MEKFQQKPQFTISRPEVSINKVSCLSRNEVKDKTNGLL